MSSASLHNYRWYHGSVNRHSTEQLLLGREPGIYLVRDSSTSAGDFVLSVSENKKVSHYIINNKGNHYKIGEQTFADIPSIISFYKNHFLDTTTLTGALPPNRRLLHIITNNYGVRELPEKYKQNFNVSSKGPSTNFPMRGLHLKRRSSAYIFEVERELKVRACYNFDGRDPDDLPFQKGDILKIVSQDEESWWTAENNKGQRGSIPVPYVQLVDEESTGSRPPAVRPVSTPLHLNSGGPTISTYFDPYKRDWSDRRSHPEPRTSRPVELPRPAMPMPSGPLLARAVIDRVCTPYDNNQIAFKKGDLLKVTKQNDNGIWEGELHGKTGEFPMSHVSLIDPNTMEPFSNGY